MAYTQNCNAARGLRHLPHWFVCAALTLVLSGCGGADGSSTDGTAAAASSADTTSSTTAAPPTASDASVAPPTISGTPGTTATVGVAYSFQPAASTSKGSVTFTITNKPSWATFNATTGLLSGTPGSGDVGTDAGIVITASHGNASASLAAFTITVAAAASTTNPTPPTQGTATVSWTAPAQNTDGSTITNLSGYVISYGSSPSAMTQTVTVSDPSATSFTIHSLVAGTWYFAVSAVETGGVSSALSAVVSTTIQ